MARASVSGSDRKFIFVFCYRVGSSDGLCPHLENDDVIDRGDPDTALLTNSGLDFKNGRQ